MWRFAQLQRGIRIVKEREGASGYAWGTAKAEDLAFTAKTLGRSDCAVHIRDLIDAFRAGLANYLEEVTRDPNREQKLRAKIGIWFTHMGQDAIKTFIEAYKN
jgi:hypothetical protein